MRVRRFTIRARLSLAYGALLAVTGALMLGVVYLFMRFVPTYALAGSMRSGRPAGDRVMSATATGAATPRPAQHGITDTSWTITTAPVVRSADDVFLLLLVISIAAFFVLGAIGGLFGWVLAGRMLRPLQRINAVVKRAGAGQLEQRVAARGPRDEVRELSDTFDDMLAELERSFGEHQRFAANASHELRTPIATIRTLLDVALSDPDLELPTLRAAAERVYEMNRRNLGTVESLLALAKAGTPALPGDEVELSALVHDALSAEHEESVRRRIDVSTELVRRVVVGAPILLRQAVCNLVQNAVRHNVDGGRIRVRLSDEAGAAVLELENDGAAVPPELVDSLTEPFVRGGGRVGARGHGLGLALVQSIADAHGADLRLTAREEGGLRISLRIPDQALDGDEDRAVHDVGPFTTPIRGWSRARAPGRR
jgi:two-component system sensor histidine kinase VanS